MPELEEVFDQVLTLQAERKANHLSAEESNLLSRINQGLSPILRHRISALQVKREGKSISDAEYEELTQLTDQSEELHAERVAAMAELAKLRGVSLPVLMEQLGIHFPEYV
ncbi:MAG: STAS/SEC14 domain-containing protein [Acidobacteria bacterium]|nr:STAS/SEC14 domain-containing protein [Acidobacteriota bacterium]